MPQMITAISKDPEAEKEQAVEHLCRVCPNCAAMLESSRCKLVCRRCGYYISCADYY